MESKGGIIMEFIKKILEWFGWKFRVAKSAIENIKTPKYSHAREKARRKKQRERGLLNFNRTTKDK